MSPQEVRLTGKIMGLVTILTVLINIAIAFTTVKLYTISLMSSVADHENRIRTIESCVSGIDEIKENVQDIPIMRTDIRWIVTSIDRMQASLDRLGESQ